MVGSVRGGPRRSSSHCCSAFRLPRSALGSPPHRPVTSQALGPGQPVGSHPQPEPYDLPREPVQQRRGAVHGAREQVHGEREHVGEPQHGGDARHRGREQRERGDAAREKQGDTAVQSHDRRGAGGPEREQRSEEHTSELQSQSNLVCRLLLENKKASISVATYPSVSVLVRSWSARSCTTRLLTSLRIQHVANSAMYMTSRSLHMRRRSRCCDI